MGSEPPWIILSIFTRVWSGWGRHSGPQDFPDLDLEPAYIFRRQTSASDSVIAVIVAARTLYLKDHPDTNLEDLVIYTTTQTHSVGAKAALVLGLQLRSIEVKAEDEFSLREDALRNALEHDTKIGRKPFILGEAFNNPSGTN